MSVRDRKESQWPNRKGTPDQKAAGKRGKRTTDRRWNWSSTWCKRQKSGKWQRGRGNWIHKTNITIHCIHWYYVQQITSCMWIPSCMILCVMCAWLCVCRQHSHNLRTRAWRLMIRNVKMMGKMRTEHSHSHKGCLYRLPRQGKP